MSFQDIFPNININSIRTEVNKRKCGKEYISKRTDTERLLYDVLLEIKKCVGLTSIYKEDIFIQLQDIGEINKKLYPGANIMDIIFTLNMDRGFSSSVVKKHPKKCDCGKDDPPCTKWLKIKNTWE